MNFDKYKNTLPYPTTAEKTAYIKAEMAKISDVPMTRVERLDAEAAINLKASEHIGRIRQAFNVEAVRLQELFRADCEQEYDFADWPQQLKNEIHRIAYEAGHSSGCQEIYNQYTDIVDLARLAREIK